MVDIRIVPDKATLGARAAALGAQAIREAQSRFGHANIIVATGASQFELLQNLVAAEGSTGPGSRPSISTNMSASARSIPRASGAICACAS
mgnify:CR=1 FL=1